MWYRVVCLKLFKVKIYRMKYFRHEIFAIYGSYNERGFLKMKSPILYAHTDIDYTIIFY